MGAIFPQDEKTCLTGFRGSSTLRHINAYGTCHVGAEGRSKDLEMAMIDSKAPLRRRTDPLTPRSDRVAVYRDGESGADRDTRWAVGRGSRRNDVPQEAFALTHELAEALTAIGTYLVVAESILSRKTAADYKTLDHVIDKILAQYSRAVDVVHNFNNIIASKCLGKN